MSFKIFLYFALFISILASNPQRNLLEEEGLSDDIIILHTNDVHCGIDDTIGYDGLMLYKKELETKYKHVLLVDAGDHIQGGAIGLLSRGKDIVDIMNELNYTFATLGNHEFDYKLERLYNLSELMVQKYICANFVYRKNKTTIFDPYRIIEINNTDNTSTKIGLIGLVTPQTLTKTYMHSVVDENGTLIYDFLSSGKGQELFETVQKYINELKNIEHVDYVIIVSHFGYGGDTINEYTSKGLLENLSGVNAIIDGHTHLVYNSTWKDKEGKDVYISQTGTRLANVGKITIKKDGNITSEIISEIPIFEGYQDYKNVSRSNKTRYVDPEMNELLEKIIASHGEELKKVIGKSDFDITGVNTKGIEENGLCDLVGDSMKYYGNSVIAVLNGGSIRKDLSKGDITYRAVLDVLPFSNMLKVLEVPGKDILDILEYGMRHLPGGSSRFSQVSGIKFKVDESIPSPVIVNEIESFVKVEGERRVYDVYVGNEALDENKNYTVSANDYMVEGGDGYSMFGKFKVVNHSDIVLSDLLRDYIEKDLGGNIPDIYKTAQGRIVKQKKESHSSSKFVKFYLGFSLLLVCLMI